MFSKLETISSHFAATTANREKAFRARTKTTVRRQKVTTNRRIALNLVGGEAQGKALAAKLFLALEQLHTTRAHKEQLSNGIFERSAAFSQFNPFEIGSNATNRFLSAAILDCFAYKWGFGWNKCIEVFHVVHEHRKDQMTRTEAS